jgi:hypothetical protein
MNDSYPRFDADVPDTSDGRRNNGYPLAKPTYDGIDLEAWVAAYGRQTPTIPAIDGPVTEVPPAESRWPTLEMIGLSEALDLVEAVAAFNQTKHPGGKWQGQSREHQAGKALAHCGRALHGEPSDIDTGLPHSAHAALRLLMMLGLELRDR